MLPASKSSVMTIAEVGQVGVFHLVKGRFDLLARERPMHLLQLLVLNGQERQMRVVRVATSSALSSGVSVAPV